MVASVNLATTKKMVARPPMVALLEIYCYVPHKKMVARPPMVALLAIWLRLLTMVASVNLDTLRTTRKNGCTTSNGCAPGNMVAFVNYGCVR